MLTRRTTWQLRGRSKVEVNLKIPKGMRYVVETLAKEEYIDEKTAL